MKAFQRFSCSHINKILYCVHRQMLVWWTDAGETCYGIKILIHTQHLLVIFHYLSASPTRLQLALHKSLVTSQ